MGYAKIDKLVDRLGASAKKRADRAKDDLINVGPAALPALLRALASENSAVRYRAAYALGKIGDGRALPALLRATRDTAPEVAYDAAIAVGHLGTLDAIPELIELFRSDDEVLASAAGSSLVALGPASIKDLMIVAGEPDFQKIRNAIFVICNIGGADARSALTRLTLSSTIDIATAAKLALEELNRDHTVRHSSHKRRKDTK